MASEDANAKKPAAPMSTMVWLAILVGLSLIGGGAGASFGFYLTSQAAAMGKDAKPATDAAASQTAIANVRELPPVITNLDQTSDTWVRLQAAIVFDSAKVEKPDVMATEISSDILGFMQTLSVAQISGSAGLQHLREDLNDRAIVRSEGRVRELVIESLVLQ